MSAGESAYEVARRQREKAERLQRSATLWEQGAAGEVEVARALEALPEGWVVLHDLAWPGRPKANIDHVVIGPGGVFVVDAKNWSGTVEVRDQVLRQNGRQRERTVDSAAEAAVALKELLPASSPCTGVLCFVGDKALSGCVRDVIVSSSSNVVAMLTARPVVMDPAEVQECANAAHTLSVRQATVPGRASKPAKAPRAGATTVRRRGRLLVAKTVVAFAFLALVFSGGLTKIAQWTAEQVGEVIAETGSPAPTPVPNDTQPRKRVKKDKNAGSRSSG